MNALIALCTAGDVYPAPLADAGYQVSGIEIPVSVGDSKVVIDIVLFRPDRNVVLAAEAKSGANVDEPQARRYGALKADDVIVGAAITIRESGERRLQPVYVCLVENANRVLRGLAETGLTCPLLTVGVERIQHRGGDFVDPDLQAAFAEPLAVPGWPPRIITVDDESPDHAFDSFVLPALVATLSHHRPEVSVPALAEQALPHLPIFGKAARNRLMVKVDAAARRAAERDPATFEYHARTGVRDHAVVRFVRSPEDAARQGRTQVYQAISRAAGKPPRQRRHTDPDQMALFDDLIEELQQPDEVAEVDDGATQEEEGQ